MLPVMIGLSVDCMKRQGTICDAKVCGSVDVLADGGLHGAAVTHAKTGCHYVMQDSTARGVYALAGHAARLHEMKGCYAMTHPMTG